MCSAFSNMFSVQTSSATQLASILCSPVLYVLHCSLYRVHKSNSCTCSIHCSLCSPLFSSTMLVCSAHPDYPITVLILDLLFFCVRYILHCSMLFLPRAHAQGVKQSSVVVVGTKIARSRVLGIYACCKLNQSVDNGEKLVSICIELLKMAY